MPCSENIPSYTQKNPHAIYIIPVFMIYWWNTLLLIMACVKKFVFLNSPGTNFFGKYIHFAIMSSIFSIFFMYEKLGTKFKKFLTSLLTWLKPFSKVFVLVLCFCCRWCAAGDDDRAALERERVIDHFGFSFFVFRLIFFEFFSKRKTAEPGSKQTSVFSNTISLTE